MPEFLLPQLYRYRRSAHECVDFALGEHRDPVAPWHRNPVNVLLWIQPDVSRKHGDEYFCIGVYPNRLAFQIPRGTYSIARDKFNAPRMGRRQHRYRRSRIDELAVGGRE